MQKIKIVWTPVAVQSLQEQVDFLSLVWSDLVVEETLNLIDENIERLILHPRLGVSFYNNTYRRLIIHSNLSLFYSLQDHVIKILLLWDNRQDPDQLKQKLKKINE